MNLKPAWLIITALLLANSAAQSEEPPQAEARNNFGEVEVFAARDDATFANTLVRNHHAFVDVSNSLVATNGLGIDAAAPEAALQAQLGLVPGQGVVVTSAPEESMGAKAGLKAHDIIEQVNEIQIGNAETLAMALDAADGTKVKLRVLRGGKPVELEATLKKPEVARVRVRLSGLIHSNLNRELVAMQEERYRIGVTLSETDDTLRAHLRLAAGEGLVVTEVIDDSAAAQAGVQQHDVLIVLDGKRLTTVDAANAQIQEIKDKSVELRLLRGAKDVTIQIAPRKSQEAAFTDKSLTYWDVKNCQRCHANPWEPHSELGRRLSAGKERWSAWTDGRTNMLFHYPAMNAAPAEQAVPTVPQEQINSLKSQLAEMQKTLANLEAALQPAPPKAEGKPEKKE